MRIWIISEGSPGHVSQSLGLARALGEEHPRQWQTRPRLRGYLRHLIRLLWMGPRGRALPTWFLKHILALEPIPANEPKPDLIISSGGRSVFAALSLARRHAVPFVFIGERKPYPSEWFHTVFTPSALETGSRDVRIDLIPTKIDLQTVTTAAAAWTDRPHGRLWTLLIGGKSRSHQFTTADWIALARGMTTIARREGIRWLVTSSRRTGRDTETLLIEHLPPEVIADAVWWCHQPEKKYAAYLGAAELIACTQDSVSMLTEAVSTGKPVVALSPAHTPFPADSFLPGYLDHLEKMDRLARVPIATMTAPGCFRNSPPKPPLDILGDMAATLTQRLPLPATTP
ncbi:MAG: ELM1/GtrOC1 family putative glycosyltransferase [Verrucomicrobiales bacterium]|nr:ELM1/GtrOC1 family putative glycosyltransferase [Verrucomicrobiota bacterium JB025]